MSTKTSTFLPLFEVNADRATGEWLAEPRAIGTIHLAEFEQWEDTSDVHYNQYKDAETGEQRAIKVWWQD
jgi:hypothetical protein